MNRLSPFGAGVREHIPFPVVVRDECGSSPYKYHKSANVDHDYHS